MMRSRLVCCIVLILVSITAAGQAIVWNGKSKSDLIGDQVYVLEDKDNKLTINDVSTSLNFKRSTQKILDFGSSNSFYWVKIVVDNETQDSLLLEVAQPRIAFADLYYKDKSGNWQVYRSGYSINLNRKVVKHQYQIFPLAHDDTEFYFRFQASAMPLPVRIWKYDVYEQKMSNQKIIYGVYMGLMIFVILINLFFFFSLKRIAYLHYAVFVFMLATFSALIDGYIMYLIPGLDLTYWYILNPILNQPIGLSYCLLFLQAWKYDRTMFKVALVALVYYISYIFWHRYLPDIQAELMGQMHALTGVLLEAIIGIRVGMKGNKLGYYFAFTYFIFFSICLLEVVYLRTGRPGYFFELSHVSIGIFFEGFFLAYLLSKRFEWEEQEKELAKANAQRLLFEKTQENERIVREQNTILEQKVRERTAELITEKKKSDDLLLNILPEDVAEELKATGSAKAKSFESVSVLFTDIKDFTKISQNQSPEELVADIDYCFRAFDAIVAKHNLEKIKTIGDAYMCAGGLPVKNQTHAEDIVMAAKEICVFMQQLKAEKIKNQQPYFEIRLGISSGPVVAGIVGSSKFAYDIWGDTVNTASRMEETGVPGKINISQSTYELVKDKFTCTYRGEIEAKNKGNLSMYFVD